VDLIVTYQLLSHTHAQWIIKTNPRAAAMDADTHMEDRHEVRDAAEEDEGDEEQRRRPGAPLDDPQVPVLVAVVVVCVV
jgi:hypothetical protein